MTEPDSQNAERHDPTPPPSKLIHLGSIGGTTLDVEPTFLFLCLFFVVIDLEQRKPMAEAALWIPVLLISVLVHELGHAGLNALLGFGRSAIILGGLGGRTLSRREGKPWQDMLVSLAGPLSSLLLALLFLLTLRALHGRGSAPLLIIFLSEMCRANYFWGLMNLVPIYPLDGGHVVRSVAAQFSNRWRAFQVSVWTSVVTGAVAIGYALFRQEFFLAIIAAMLVLQNFQAWSAVRTAQREHSENRT